MQRTWLCWSEACSKLSYVHRADPVLFKQAFISLPAKLTARSLERCTKELRASSTTMGTKRSLSDDEKPSKASKVALVDSRRVRTLSEGSKGDGPVVYWMSRDQRMSDNWALLHAAEEALKADKQVAVCFNLVDEFLDAGARQFGFMLRGLREMAPKLEAANIRFHLLRGNPKETVPELVKILDAALLITDQSPLNLPRQWREDVKEAVSCPFHEVDAHNIVPVWETSEKREYAARTIRPKIHKKLSTFLEEFPELPELPAWEDSSPGIEWDTIIEEVTERGKAVPEVSEFAPGEDAARAALTGKDGFVTARLKGYNKGRNDPNKPKALSCLSPYFHFGQLSTQRAALEASKHRGKAKEDVEAFIEESVVRRELSDNFCFYETKYDSLECAAAWAQDTLQAHAKDKRPHVYTLEQFEAAKTHEDVWNAAQREMVHLGKMHGFMRMYWAKKILEWSASPAEALETALYLNNKYELDGRDPNGYVGCLWSIAGIHDHGWTEREITGKIRYMNYNGCKRKFDIKAYCASVEQRIKAQKQAAKKQ
eukprot:jgi/Ulvmu1/6683/UM030_0014.1